MHSHVRWVPCHHGMVCHIADGEGLQIWRVIANILIKQLRTADKGWSSRWLVRRGANNPLAVKLYLVTKCFKASRTLTDSLARTKL
jgi:hypothetical protein